MYNDAMDAVADHLITKSEKARLTYTAELVPQRTYSKEMSVPLRVCASCLHSC